MEPAISLIVPAFNEEKYLGSTFSSVAKAPGAFGRMVEGGAVETIVVDNGSTDRTVRIAQLHGARVVGEKERRIASVRNAGARAALGQVIGFLMPTAG